MYRWRSALAATSAAGLLLLLLVPLASPASAASSPTTVPGAFEVAVAPGSYTVTVGVGDPSYLNSVHRILVEGAVDIAGFVPTATVPYKAAAVTVPVSDGRVTVTATGGSNTKIEYLTVVNASTGKTLYRFDFSAPGATPAPGYLLETGQPYAARTSGAWGWVKAGTLTPQDMTGNAVRRRASLADTRLNGLVHMQWAPLAPTSLNALPGSGQAVLSWPASTSNAVTGYQVLRDGRVVAYPTATEYADAGLVNGTPYSYCVKAVEFTTVSAFCSPTATVTPVGATSEAVAPVAGSSAWCSGIQVTPGMNVVTAVNGAAAGATVCVNAGRYQVGTAMNPRTGVRIYGQPGTVLDGSVPLTGWVQSGSAWKVTGKLPANYTGTGQCEDSVTNPCLRNEQVWYDGAHLARVASTAAVAPGTFYADYTANVIYLGSDPTGHTVEMSRTPYAVNATNSNGVLSGVTVQRFASPGQKGAVFINGASGWLIDKVTARWNHALGVFITASAGTTVRDCVIHENGQLGLGVHNSTGFTATGNTISDNNTDGFWVIDWESGGFKSTKSSGLFARNTVTGNKGVGVWYDIDNNGTTAEYNTISGNWADGIRIEISYNAVIRFNTVTSNGLHANTVRGGGTSIYATAGINSNTSSNVDIYGNTVADNMNGIGLQARNRGTGLYGVWTLANNTVHDNTITMRSGSLYGQGATGLVQNVGDTSYFTSKGNTFTGNTYNLDSSTAKRFAWNGTYVTASTWVGRFGNDTAGSFAFAA